MRFDLHTHTSRYSSCARATPEEMMAGAVEQGLDGIVITEHDTIWSEAEIRELQHSYPQLTILRGIEVHTASGEDIVVLGITDASLFHRYMDDAVLGEIIDKYQGAAILAHPYRYLDGVSPEALRLPLHGVEVASSNIRQHMQAPIAGLIRKHGLRPIASSDAHWPENVGLYGVEFLHPVTSETELAAAVRKGAFRLFMNEERVRQVNTELNEQVSLARRLLNQGYSIYEIRDICGFSQSMLAALQAGKQVHLVSIP
ncbi:MAG: PHP domain-containing protein [Firmicutes bacterium]|jgi:predicted metal-dependent phosphoesterase TrpH|nr:PHP domain-containing protein [Bacillota bacterium]